MGDGELAFGQGRGGAGRPHRAHRWPAESHLGRCSAEVITKRRFRRMIVASACFPAENPCRTSTVGAPSTEFPSTPGSGNNGELHFDGMPTQPSDPVNFQ